VTVAVVSAVSERALIRLDLDLFMLVVSKVFDVDKRTKGVVGLCRQEV
jgi:hypothetical protein